MLKFLSLRHKILPQEMLPTIFESCNAMMGKWDKMISSNGSSEMDVWPLLGDLISDIISRTVFGSTREEGNRIVQLLGEQAKHAANVKSKAFILSWR